MTDAVEEMGDCEAELFVALIDYRSGDMAQKIEAYRTMRKIAALADAYVALLKAQEEQTNGQ